MVHSPPSDFDVLHIPDCIVPPQSDFPGTDTCKDATNSHALRTCFRASIKLFSYQRPERWRIRGSNPRPQACKARALPAELIPQEEERPLHKSVSQDRIARRFVMGIDRISRSRSFQDLQKGGDPTAGSPTVTLLRLSPHHGFRLRRLSLRTPATSDAPRFGGLTGGVYKAQEHIHRGSADPRLLAIPASCGRVAARNPN